MRIGQPLQAIDPEIGAKDALERDAADARPRESSEVLQS